MKKRVRRVKRIKKHTSKPKIKKEIFEPENEVIDTKEAEKEIENFENEDFFNEDIFSNLDFEERIKSENEDIEQNVLKENINNEHVENNENLEDNDDELFEYQGEDEKVSLKEALNFKITKKTVLTFFCIIIAAFILGFTLFKLFPGGKSFSSVVNLGDTLTNGKVECTVEDIVVTDTISTIKADSGKTFVCIYYEYKNISNSEIKWEDFPYITLGIFENDEAGSRAKKELDNDNVNKEALREYSYVMGLDLRDDLDPLAASSTRDDVDVFEIDKSYLTNNKIYILFDIYDKAIKVEEGLSTLPNLDETIKENQQEIKKEQEEMGIQDTPEDSQSAQ